MNERKLERVARAICGAAGRSVQPQCPMCEDSKCVLWPQFLGEAMAAIKAMKGFNV